MLKELTEVESEMHKVIVYFSNCGSFDYLTIKKLLHRNNFVSIFRALHKKGYVYRIYDHPIHDFKVS